MASKRGSKAIAVPGGSILQSLSATNFSSQKAESVFSVKELSKEEFPMKERSRLRDVR